MKPFNIAHFTINMKNKVNVRIYFFIEYTLVFNSKTTIKDNVYGPRDQIHYEKQMTVSALSHDNFTCNFLVQTNHYGWSVYHILRDESRSSRLLTIGQFQKSPCDWRHEGCLALLVFTIDILFQTPNVFEDYIFKLRWSLWVWK